MEKSQSLRNFGQIQEVIVALAEYSRGDEASSRRKKVPAEFSTARQRCDRSSRKSRQVSCGLAALSELKISAGHLHSRKALCVRSARFDVRIALLRHDRRRGESARLRKKIEGLEKAIASKEKQLADATFRAGAGKNHPARWKRLWTEQRLELQKLRKRLGELDKAA